MEEAPSCRIPAPCAFSFTATLAIGLALCYPLSAPPALPHHPQRCALSYTREKITLLQPHCQPKPHGDIPLLSNAAPHIQVTHGGCAGRHFRTDVLGMRLWLGQGSVVLCHGKHGNEENTRSICTGHWHWVTMCAASLDPAVFCSHSSVCTSPAWLFV